MRCCHDWYSGIFYIPYISIVWKKEDTAAILENCSHFTQCKRPRSMGLHCYSNFRTIQTCTFCLWLMNIIIVYNCRNLKWESKKEKKLNDFTKRKKWKLSKFWAERLKRASQTWICKWSIFFRKYKKTVRLDKLSLRIHFDWRLQPFVCVLGAPNSELNLLTSMDWWITFLFL